MSVLSDFNANVLLRVPEVDAIMDSDARDAAVLDAVATFSRLRPQRLVATIAGDGSTYDLELPANFDLQTSFIQSVEYPAGERRPVYVNPDDWTVYRSDSSTAVLRLYAATPATGEDVQIIYTTAHVVDGSGSTIDAGDEAALSDLAASILCERIAAYYSQSTNASFVVDSTNHVSQAGEYALRAKRFRELALEHLGVATGSGRSGAAAGASVPGAAIIKDRDSTRLDRSIRLTHPQT
jgi:hypothetical protein